jgi:hypothetical protein
VRIILKWIRTRVYIGFNWIRIGSTGRPLLKMVKQAQVPKYGKCNDQLIISL